MLLKTQSHERHPSADVHGVPHNPIGTRCDKFAGRIERSRCPFSAQHKRAHTQEPENSSQGELHNSERLRPPGQHNRNVPVVCAKSKADPRSEEHTSELQSHSFISYAV